MTSTTTDSKKRADAERLADLFTVLQRSFVLNLSRELSRGNVSYPQYMLLCFLIQEPEPLTMTAVAERMRHTTAAATGIVDRLEKLGFAKRGNAAKDRRKILVHITPKGEELVQKVRNDMVNNIMRLMGHLDPIEQTTWLSIYEKIYPHCPR
jgi:DNA-binding MarR family transcriptional regulator